MWKLLRVPTGCPEQTLSSLAPVIILTHYLDTTGNWGKVGVELREQVIKNIVSGEKGSFWDLNKSVWDSLEGWLGHPKG